MRHIVIAAAVWAGIAGSTAAENFRVVISGGYFPFTFAQQDQLQGFEVDFIESVAE
jgi:putative amino-acid transport system substrate-binding protein